MFIGEKELSTQGFFRGYIPTSETSEHDMSVSTYIIIGGCALLAVMCIACLVAHRCRQKTEDACCTPDMLDGAVDVL